MSFITFKEFQRTKRYEKDLATLPLIGDNFEYEKNPVKGYTYFEDCYYIQKTGNVYHTILGIEEPCSDKLEDVEKALYDYFFGGSD